MSDNVREATYAFNTLLVDKLNSAVSQLPTDVPYTISHFFVVRPLSIHCELADGRCVPITYVTRPNLDDNTFTVAAYFESSTIVDPITVVVMDDQMLGIHQRFVEAFIDGISTPSICSQDSDSAP